MKQQKIKEQQEPIPLDDRIKQDLTELYRILHTPAQLKGIKEEVLGISAAVKLSKDLYSEDKHKDDDAYALSTLGLPGYFTGDREAKTVMVMLNPGISAMENDNPLRTMKSIKDLGIDFDKGVDEFINSYIEKNSKYGEHKSYKVDAFDLKQAVFLSAWEDTGVNIPKGFPELLKEKTGKKDAVIKRKIDKLKKEATINVLTKKLQLELIPYASRKFDTNNANLEVLMPYLETLLHEINPKTQTNVIFCSDFFERLFNYANGRNEIQIEFIKRKEPIELKEKGEDKSKKAFCSVVNISCKVGNKKKTFKAIIAHTFSNQSLPNAYDKMREYGLKCFECLNEYQQTHKS